MAAESTYTIVGGTVLDGTGRPAEPGDVLVADGRIAAAGPGLPPQGRVIDARGLIVCPGFIDMHSHSGLVALAEPRVEPKVRQGITTEVPGVDGLSPAPIRAEHVVAWRTHVAGLDGDPPIAWSWSSFAEYLDRLRGTSTNWAPVVGHGAIRQYVLGMEQRPPTPDELRRMADLLDVCFQEGAFGLSTGLVYTPAAYTDLDELVALGRVVARYGRFFDWHLRFEGERLERGIAELIEVGQRSGCAIHISHFKVASRPHWGSAERFVEQVDAARRAGIDASFDQYPYTAGSTMLARILPPWAHAGGATATLERLRSSQALERMERDIVDGLPDWESSLRMCGSWDAIVVSSVRSDRYRAVEGLDLAAIGARWGCEPFAAAVRLLLDEQLNVGMITHLLAERDVATILRVPWGMIGTDGLFAGRPHPRVYGTFPRILGTYVREQGVLDLPTAIHKMTGLAAERLRLADRGRIAPGLRADLTLFDPATVAERGTYADPRHFPDGIRHVLVNGQLVVEDGRHTGALPGRELARFSLQEDLLQQERVRLQRRSLEPPVAG